MSPSTIRNIIIASILMVVAAGGFGVMSYQTMAQGKHLESQIEVLAAEQAQEDLFLRLRKIADSSTEDRAALQSFFLDQDKLQSDSIDFLNYVDEIAAGAGVVIGKVEIDTLKARAGASEEWVQVVFPLSGTRMQVQQFIRLLELLPYVSRVTDVTLEIRSSEQWNANVTMQVKVMAYEE
ncbi:MAG: hypothetical protein KC877_02530 [Candidatus Kaiserbacteria bacterium]|nr:hypothetical protein [Candidatus Kaiserbacteria bacterium]MCB9816442.1 hypothetical protein [Candidatus Nomurabacteria bacterium]